ncbi:MAG: hypothetical protein ACX931_07005 [Saccharospirillum sp.]
MLKTILGNMPLLFFSAAINFVSILVFYPLITSSKTEDYVYRFAVSLMVLLFVQVIDSLRYPIVQIASKSAIKLTIEASYSLIIRLVTILGVIAIFMILFVRNEDIIYVFLVVACSFVMVPAWAQLDLTGRVGVGAIIKSLTLLAYLSLVYSLDQKNLYKILFFCYFLGLISIMIISKSYLVLFNERVMSLSNRPNKEMVNKFILVSSHMLIANIHGSADRIMGKLVFGNDFFVAITYFSEFVNRLSFVPRLIYSAALPVLSKNEFKVSEYSKYIFAIFAFVIALLVFIILSFSQELLFSIPPLELYSEYSLVFIVLVSCVAFKFLGYFSVLLKNSNGDFKTQVIIGLVFLFPLPLFLLLDYDSIYLFIFVVILMKSSDIFLFFYKSRF